MKRAAIIIMLITAFSKIFGFFRDVMLSYFYGTSNISDAYLIALAIPGIIFSFFGTGIVTGYIPMYSKIEQFQGLEEANRFTNNLINMIVVACTILVILGLLFTSQVVKLFATGFEGETLRLAVQFTRIGIFGMYFSGLVYVFTGFLQIKGKYNIAAFIGVPLNFITILFIYISTKTNITMLAVGSVIAVASQLMILIPVMHKKGYRYKYIFNIKDKNIANMTYIALPVIIGVSVDQINVVVDKTIASTIVIGGISALNYANKLISFVLGLFVLSLSTVMFPMISKLAAEKNIDKLKKSLAEAIQSINLLLIPATFGAIIFAKPIVNVLFARGAFDSAAIVMTSTAFLFYSMGMIGVGLREIVSRAFYSLQDTKTPMINAVISMLMNIVLNLTLSKYMGIGGLALASSISAIFCTVMLLISLRKKIGPFGMKGISISSLKMLFASSVMGVAAYVIYSVINKIMGNIKINDFVSLFVAIGFGVVVYLLLCYQLRISEVRMLFSEVKRRVYR